MLKIKSGEHAARVAGLRPEMVLALKICDGVFAQYDLDCVVTSAVDGAHSPGSLHYVGQAADLRNRHVPSPVRPTITKELKEALGDDYDVVAEGSHWHVEFQPKTGVNL